MWKTPMQVQILNGIAYIGTICILVTTEKSIIAQSLRCLIRPLSTQGYLQLC